MYHLYDDKDKRQALREAIRVTKQGGVIFAAYVISDGCLLDEGFNRGNVNVAEYIEQGLLDARTFAAKSEPKDLFELVRKEDIDDSEAGELFASAKTGKTNLCVSNTAIDSSRVPPEGIVNDDPQHPDQAAIAKESVQVFHQMPKAEQGKRDCQQADDSAA